MPDEPQDPLDRLIEDIELQISLAPEGVVMTALQAQLDGLKRHRAARQLNEEPLPEA